MQLNYTYGYHMHNKIVRQMRNIYLVIFLALFMSGCNIEEEAAAVKHNISTEKTWVFAQFNVPYEGEGVEDFYYYGKISKPLYTTIKNNRIKSGFILMDDVMYWGKDDLIHDYADGENEGEIVFRIEDIRKIELVNRKPKAGLGSEQFESDVSTIEATPNSETTIKGVGDK